MDLRRVRLRLTLLYTLLAALAVGSMAWYAVRTGSDQLMDAAERDAQQVVNEYLLDDASAEADRFLPPNTWVVFTGDDESSSYEWAVNENEVWVEPPLQTLAEEAGEHPSFLRFEQNGPWLAYVQGTPYSDEQIVTVVALDDVEADVDSLRFRVIVAAVGSVVAMGVAGHWLSGRSLRPARRALQQQRDFIADAAHEMRTPLAIIKASASHTLSRERDAEQYRQSLDEIYDAAVRASDGVGELLELARLEAGQAAPRLAPLRLDLLVEEVAAAVRVDGVTIEATVGEALIVDADYSLLRQGVENLTRNAAARASTVELSTERYGEQWGIVNIADDGPGFDPDVLDGVFDRFRRGDGKGSSGLGMAIARTIAEAHGGRCDATNRLEGGALVRLVVPLSSTER